MPCTSNTTVRNGESKVGKTEMHSDKTGIAVELGTVWEGIPRGMSDPIFKITRLYRNDTNERRVNLSVGVYQNEQGKQTEFKAVREARQAYDMSKESGEHGYLPPAGHPGFCSASARLIFGGCVRKEQLTTVQTVAGSGALRLAMEFSRRFLNVRRVYLSDPTWANHSQLVKDTSLKASRYRYYDAKTGKARADWVVEDLKQADFGSLVVLQACGHNPTGADLDTDGWYSVLDVVMERKLIPLFDVAYQGLVSGDLEEDVRSVRLFAQSVGMLVAHSFSKSMGLYGERVGTLSVVTPHQVSAVNVDSQLQYLVRGMYSSPPSYGARLAHLILTDERRYALWRVEIKEMLMRMRQMRQKLGEQLDKHGANGRWDFIQNGRGMFTYLGLAESQVRTLIDVHHVYLTEDSRVNLAGLNEQNVDRVAAAICKVSLGM